MGFFSQKMNGELRPQNKFNYSRKSLPLQCFFPMKKLIIAMISHGNINAKQNSRLKNDFAISDLLHAARVALFFLAAKVLVIIKIIKTATVVRAAVQEFENPEYQCSHSQ